MHNFKLIPVIFTVLISMPVMAEEPLQSLSEAATEIPLGQVEMLGQPAAEATVEMQDEQTGELPLFKYIKPEREGPATATDRIVDRFMEMNINPEESAGVDFEEYFTMVQQRAMDRFEAMDMNQDDEVTEEEYREFWKTQKAQYYRLKR
ncbi:MAG: hypothetical protein R8K54_04370 [Mariprofundaceae bacterium]